jgi:hypothetical protein
MQNIQYEYIINTFVTADIAYPFYIVFYTYLISAIITEVNNNKIN